MVYGMGEAASPIGGGGEEGVLRGEGGGGGKEGVRGENWVGAERSEVFGMMGEVLGRSLEKADGRVWRRQGSDGTGPLSTSVQSQQRRFKCGSVPSDHD